MRAFKRIACRIAVGVVIILAGCATIPVENMQLVTGILTTGGSGESFDRSPKTEPFGIGDRVFFLTTLRWVDLKSGAGIHKVRWKWYSRHEIAAVVERSYNFYMTPFELRGVILASALGPGRHKVEVFIDESFFDSREFDVKE
ncbi:MAG: hypothetical protein KAJ19_24685 [Gammaproteobacteria bacterium]|nr:hypothetical protein [Gammaproteobacteria bacterium]